MAGGRTGADEDLVQALVPQQRGDAGIHSHPAHQLQPLHVEEHERRTRAVPPGLRACAATAP